jgi:hypothetical protein
VSFALDDDPLPVLRRQADVDTAVTAAACPHDLVPLLLEELGGFLLKALWMQAVPPRTLGL